MEKASLTPREVNLTLFARPRTHQEIDELEEKLIEHDNRIQQMNTSQETLNKRFLELTELRHVLKETTIFFQQVFFFVFFFYCYISYLKIKCIVVLDRLKIVLAIC